MNASGTTSRIATADNHASVTAAEGRMTSDMQRNRKPVGTKEVNGLNPRFTDYGLENGGNAATGRGGMRFCGANDAERRRNPVFQAAETERNPICS